MKKEVTKFQENGILDFELRRCTSPTPQLRGSCGGYVPGLAFLGPEGVTQTSFSENCGCMFWPVSWLPGGSTQDLTSVFSHLELSQGWSGLLGTLLKALKGKSTSHNHLGQGITGEASSRESEGPVKEEAEEGDKQRKKDFKKLPHKLESKRSYAHPGLKHA